MIYKHIHTGHEHKVQNQGNLPDTEKTKKL